MGDHPQILAQIQTTESQFAPSRIEALEGQIVPHLCDLEMGDAVEETDLIQNCHQRQLQTMINLPNDPVPSHCLPSLSSFEAALRTTTPHRTVLLVLIQFLLGFTMTMHRQLQSFTMLCSSKSTCGVQNPYSSKVGLCVSFTRRAILRWQAITVASCYWDLLRSASTALYACFFDVYVDAPPS